MSGVAFHPGDLVSCGDLVGVVVILHRRRDNAAFLMVEISSGPRKGERHWPNTPPWQLGAGPDESVCGECERRYRRRTDEDPIFCVRCRRDEHERAAAMSKNPAQRPTSWQRK